MKRTWSAALVAGALLLSLNGCGGGPSNNVNPPPDGGQEVSSQSLLTLDAATIPDNNLRACLNQGAAKNNWQVVEDVESITCGDVEIRSIQGLQNFPNLHQLKIAAPRLSVDEIPLLASLPLSDYQHKPYYDFGDESSPDNATPVMKQLLMDGRVNLSSDQVVTYVVLVAEDPASGHVPQWAQYRFGYTALDVSSLPHGAVGVGPYVSLYWIQVGKDDSEQFSTHPFLSDTNGQLVEPEIFTGPNAIPADRPIDEIEFADNVLKTCVDDLATSHGWTTTWQVTALDCSGRGINNIDGIEYFPQLQRVDLSHNPLSSISVMAKLPVLQWVDLRGDTLDADPNNVLGLSGATLLYDESSVAPPAPEVDIRECGLHISNFDNNTHYRVLQTTDPAFAFGVTYENAYMLFSVASHEFEDWQPGSAANCMPIANRGAGIWIVDAIKNGLRTGAHKYPCTDAGGNFIAYLLDGISGPPWMTVPGNASDAFYVLSTSAKQYRVERHDLTSFQLTGVTGLHDLLPYYATKEGVYLFPARLPSALESNEAALLNVEGNVRELPPRPLSGRPDQVLAFGDEIWLFGLHNDWGGTPDILVWNPHAEQWHQVQPSPSTNYSALIRDGKLCIRYPTQSATNALCWNSTQANWVDTEVPTDFRDESVSLDGYGYSFSRSPGFSALAAIIGPKTPVTIANGEDAYAGSILQTELLQLFPVDQYFSLLDQQDPSIGEWSPFGPPLPGLPFRMNLTAKDGYLYALFNDSIVRYNLTPPPVSVVSP